MYTIKSVSDEGTFYLVKNWNKQKTFWKLGSEIRAEDLYKTKGAAKGSLKKLLKVMDEYKNDEFSLVETNEDNEIVLDEKIVV